MLHICLTTNNIHIRLYMKTWNTKWNWNKKIIKYPLHRFIIFEGRWGKQNSPHASTTQNIFFMFFYQRLSFPVSNTSNGLKNGVLMQKLSRFEECLLNQVGLTWLSTNCIFHPCHCPRSNRESSIGSKRHLSKSKVATLRFKNF